jgi:hypothetical protein
MRFVLVTLSCPASLMAVQATTFVTVVKTVVQDEVVSSVDHSASDLGFDQTVIGRRDEDDQLGDPSVTQVCITSPVTTCLDVTVPPSDKSKDTTVQNTSDNDDGSWVEITETLTPTTKIKESPQDITVTLTQTDSSDHLIRNTGSTTIHSKVDETYTAIPDWWPPAVGPNSDPMVEPPVIPNIVNPDWTPINTETTARYCDVYPLPSTDPRCQEQLLEKRTASVTSTAI